MGKQTKQKGSNFGGDWTIQKLYIIEEYLKTYCTALKNQNVKKIYVDGFAGSGKTALKSHKTINNEMQATLFNEYSNDEDIVVDGSALISLQFDFDEYYFIELDEGRISTLKGLIKEKYPGKYNKVHFITGDSNVKLLEVISKITLHDRCVMFLDPYALELKWSTLEKIAECTVVDLWYLFPLSLIRLIEKQKDIPEHNKEKVTSILGTDKWLEELFVESSQMNFFNDTNYDRVDYKEILDYVRKRFETIFPYVSPNSKILTNEKKNAPMFMLCFMMTNTSSKAQQLAARLVKGIIKSTEKL
ncbi:MAG: three-Cys-motif partner protein TcmP [Oscillospiraceae bacterium]|nr:three-Cys-motif partner protein TcmP [Oscillospiraceae bacterium]